MRTNAAALFAPLRLISSVCVCYVLFCARWRVFMNIGRVHDEFSHLATTKQLNISNHKNKRKLTNCAYICSHFIAFHHISKLEKILIFFRSVLVIHSFSQPVSHFISIRHNNNNKHAFKLSLCVDGDISSSQIC